MKNLRTKTDYDFDDYFMQRINCVEFSNANLTLTVADRTPLKFCGVGVVFAELKAFKDCANKTLYSLFVKEDENDYSVELKVLCEEELCELSFTAKEIEM